LYKKVFINFKKKVNSKLGKKTVTKVKKYADKIPKCLQILCLDSKYKMLAGKNLSSTIGLHKSDKEMLAIQKMKKMNKKIKRCPIKQYF
jgi:hypothetical protein